MNKIFIILLFSISIQLKSQIIIKFNYDSDWNICTQERASFYREINLDTINYTLDGNFVDYSTDNVKILTGKYEKGIKNGDFVFYDTTGVKYCEGIFANNIPSKTWAFFYSNGQIKCNIEFINDSFKILGYYDTDGKKIIQIGTGQFEFSFINDFGFSSNQNLIGMYENFVQVKKWRIYDNDKIIATENYKKGELKSVSFSFENFNSDKIHRTINGLKYEHNKLIVWNGRKPINNYFFIPQRLFSAENMNFNQNVTIEDYPFIPILPSWEEIPAVGLIKDSTINNLDIKPKYIGGMLQLRKDILRIIIFPKEAIEQNLSGTVYVELILDETGNIHSSKSIPRGKEILEKEAERALKQLDNFKAGYYKEESIMTKFIVPVTFNKPIRLN